MSDKEGRMELNSHSYLEIEYSKLKINGEQWIQDDDCSEIITSVHRHLPVLHWVPVNPGLQLHVNSFTPSMQVPPF